MLARRFTVGAVVSFLWNKRGGDRQSSLQTHCGPKSTWQLPLPISFSVQYPLCLVVYARKDPSQRRRSSASNCKVTQG